MQGTKPDGPIVDSPGAALAEAGWFELQDRIVRALIHDLNGRIAALSAAQQLVDLGEPIPEGFSRDLERMTGVSARLHDLVGRLGAPPAALTFPPLVERALAIHRSLKEVGRSEIDISADTELKAIFVREGLCLRTILLFVDLAANASGEPRAALSLRGDDDGVELSCTVGDGSLDDDAIAALNRLAEADGGGVSATGSSCTLRLPSLAHARPEGR